jgi:hypothetical protein
MRGAVRSGWRSHKLWHRCRSPIVRPPYAGRILKGEKTGEFAGCSADKILHGGQFKVADRSIEVPPRCPADEVVE